MLNDVIQLGKCLSNSQRREAVFLLALSVLAGASEFVTIGALVPFLTLLLAPQGSSIGTVFDFLLARLPSGEIGIFWLAATIAGLAAISGFIRITLVWRSEQFCARLGHGLVQSIYVRVMREDIASFEGRNSSDVLAGMDKVQAVIGGFVQPLLAAMTNAIIALCLLALLMIVAPLLAIGLSLVLALSYGVFSILAVPHIGRHAADMSQGWEQRVRALRESLGAKREIMLSRSFSQFEALLAKADWRFRSAYAGNQAIAKSPRALFQPGLIIAIVAAASAVVWIGSSLSAVVPVLAAVALAMQRLLPLVQGVWSGSVQSSGNRDLVRDVVELRRTPLANQDTRQIAPLGLGSKLECVDLDFAYPEGGSILTGVDLTVEKGQWIGITGPSGAGKSTLLDLLIGFRQPNAGGISLDGVTLQGERLMRWQNAVGYVREASFLLDGSIADNICFGVAARDRCIDRLQSVIAIAELDNLVKSLGGGIEAEIGEGGVKLSAGQRQRVAIARALYRSPSALILDEATNAMDLALEETIFRAIREAIPDLSVIMVSHRTQSLERCSRCLEVREKSLVQLSAPLANECQSN